MIRDALLRLAGIITSSEAGGGEGEEKSEADVAAGEVVHAGPGSEEEGITEEEEGKAGVAAGESDPGDEVHSEPGDEVEQPSERGLGLGLGVLEQGEAKRHAVQGTTRGI